MDNRPAFDFPRPLLIDGLGLQLREWSDDDVADLVAIYDDPEIDRWTPVPSPFDAVAASAYLAAAEQKGVEGRTVQLAITTDGGPARGEILLFRNAVDERDLELAYGVGPAHRGRGIATRAVRLAVDFAGRRVGPRRMVLCIENGNTASERVARAAGFSLTNDRPVVREAKGREVVLRTWSHDASDTSGSAST
ncbi:GNAT family N-acetyltransferase [Streptomyces sp. Tue6028]|uniref:GNAT family N-acetyltransferase n=1 Tax=Streptomyces sp. Tue6028 TaxID=2036037 RepID=UPI000BB3515F|nr:GNAT family N-acetyltransferase [Streptomyces sp. Tue6028]PBC65908.1 GNAT family N-acetyltransferase [Streptomyces sp. Tue6028]